MNVDQGFANNILEHFFNAAGTAFLAHIRCLAGISDAVTAKKAALFHKFDTDILSGQFPGSGKACNPPPDNHHFSGLTIQLQTPYGF